jgi:predicted DNA binding CopG/RHH family protein
MPRVAKPNAKRWQCNLRLAEDELVRMRLVATHYGIDVSSLVRMLIKRDHDRLLNEGAI